MCKIRCDEDGRESYAGTVGDYLKELGRSEEAVDWWTRGFYWAHGSGNIEKAINWGKLVFWNMRDNDARRSELGRVLGRTQLDAGMMDDARDVLADVIESGVDVDTVMCAGDVLSDLYENRGAGDKWTALIERMSGLEEQAGRKGRHALYCARSMWRNTHGERAAGLEDAEKAFLEALPGEEAQRAAQRIVYCCLPVGALARAEEAARDALTHSNERLDLRARSLRSLGIVYTWQGRGEEAIGAQKEVLELCRLAGLRARVPVALHDLGEACRMALQIDEAQKHYGESIRVAENLELESTVLLGGYKLVVCELLRGHVFNNTVSRLEDMWKVSEEAGLAIARPYSKLLISWAHAIENNSERSMEALQEIGPLATVVIDPQFGLILEQIAEGIAGDDDLSALSDEKQKSVQMALEVAKNAWSFVGNAEHLARCQDRLEALSNVQIQS